MDCFQNKNSFVFPSRKSSLQVQISTVKDCFQNIDGFVFPSRKTSLPLQNDAAKIELCRKISNALDYVLDMVESNEEDQLSFYPPRDFCGYFETEKLKCELETSGFVLLSGELMKQLLLFFGASIEDLNNLESGKIHLGVASDPEPKMVHRQIAFHRILFEQEKETKSNEETYLTILPAMAQAVTQIPEKEIASTAEEGSKLNHTRSGLRYWPMPPQDYSEHSSVPMAMALLNAELLPERHHPQANINHEHKTTVNDQLLIRTTRESLADESYSPTPEGIHQDNTEISSVTLVGLRGVVSGGESRVWKLETPTGNYSEDKFNEMVVKNNLLLNHALRIPWETLYFNDRVVKHEARSFDGERPCTRDVIVNFLRKPLKGGEDKKMVNGSIIPISDIQNDKTLPLADWENQSPLVEYTNFRKFSEKFR